MIHFLVPAAGAFGMEDYLALDRPSPAGRFRIIPYERLGEHKSFDRGTYVFSGLDQLHGASQRLVVQLHDALAGAPGVRLLNDPRRTLRRFPLLAALHQSGRNMFRAARADGDLAPLRYPVFLRTERFHGGSISPLLDSRRALEAAIGLALLRGHTLSDLLAIEYCSTAASDGLFRKYAAFKVGDRILGRCLYHGRDWMLKFEGSEYTREFVLEEQEYVMHNPHAAALAEIFGVAAVDYGQIDYALLDGRIQTWEINVNPTIGRGVGLNAGPSDDELRQIRSVTRDYFFDWFREAWGAVDLRPAIGAPIRVTFEPSAVAAAAQAAAHEVRDARVVTGAGGARSGPVGNVLRAILRPVKRPLQRISTPLLRVIAFAARSWSRRPALLGDAP